MNKHARQIYADFKSTAVGREGRNLMTDDMIRSFIDGLVLDHLRIQDDSISWESLRGQIDEIREQVFKAAGVPA